MESIGFASFTGTDDAFVAPRAYFHRIGVQPELVRSYVFGEVLRDWSYNGDKVALTPYDSDQAPLDYVSDEPWGRHLWYLRTRIGSVKSFGGKTRFECGDDWWTWYRWVPRKYSVPPSIAFAFVATHNHFVFERGGKVFSRTAPVIKLRADATEADHLALLDVLNSSVACFWMKQVFHNKGSTVDTHGARQTTDAFENFYEHTGTGLKQLPLPANRPTAVAEALDRLAAERQAHLPAQLAEHYPLAPVELDAHRDEAATLLARMIALQEELDWECYRLYGLVAEDCRYAGDESPASERPPGSQRVHAGQCSGAGVPGSAGILPASKIAGLRPVAGGTPALPGAASPSVGSRRASGVTHHHAGEANHHGERSSHPESTASDGRRSPNDAVAHREPPPLALGERAFEIVMARRMAAGELETTWFARHGATPITEPPAHWPDDYRALVERRIALVESDRFIGLVERPEYKRRWNVEPWHDQERRTLRRWLLDRLESPAYWPEVRLATVRALAERAATDADFQQVAARYAGHAGADLDALVEALVESESVPALPVLRYKLSGLAKRADWERTWARQRHEDRIDAEVEASTPRREDETGEQHASRLEAARRRRKRVEVGEHPPPPKYRSADFLKPVYWRLRGALDVPKERFVSFPTMSRDSDPTPLVGWAGWNPLDLCQAVATYCTEVVEQDGWPPERTAPLLAVVQENLPWLKQWHNEIDPEYNQRLGDFFETWLHSQLSLFGLTEDDLRAWTPPGPKRGPRARRGTAGARGPAVPGPGHPPTG